MTKIQRLSLIAAFTVFAAIALPQSCYAQPPELLTFTVDGSGSLNGAVYAPPLFRNSHSNLAIHRCPGDVDSLALLCTWQ